MDGWMEESGRLGRLRFVVVQIEVSVLHFSSREKRNVVW